MAEQEQQCNNEGCTECAWESSRQDICSDCGHIFFPEDLTTNEYDYIFCHECYDKLDQYSYRERLNNIEKARKCTHEELVLICLKCSKPSELTDCESITHKTDKWEVCKNCKYPVYDCDTCSCRKLQSDGMFVGGGSAYCPTCVQRSDD